MLLMLISACGGGDGSSGDRSNQKPSASFSHTCMGQSCNFDAKASSDADGNITSYSWDFGDGSSGNGESPDHDYIKSGLYSVELTITDDDGASSIAINESEVFSTSAVATIQTIWDYHKPSMETYLREQFAAGITLGLYVTQITTRNLLRYAAETKDLGLLDDLTALYLVPLEYINEEDTYTYFYLPDGQGGYTYTSALSLSPPAKMWQQNSGIESKLDVSQFLIAISQTLNFILEVDENQRSANMQVFLQQYPAIVLSHYNRWVFDDPSFQLRGWACIEGVRNHYDRVEKLLAKGYDVMNDYSYCNGVFDTDMFIIAGVGELLAANKKQPLLVPLTTNEITRFQDYAALGSAMLESRITEVALTNLSGEAVTGAVFDIGMWEDYGNYAYAGYSGAAYPTEIDKQTSDVTGQDVSHASRFVTIFASLRRNRVTTGQSFPDNQTMTKFANMMAYAVFNKDLNKPSFSTYMGGVDGWYRVGYSGREGFGYAPGNMSSTVLTGGYAYWRKYNSDLRTILDASWNYAINNDAADNPFKHGCWYDYAPACDNFFNSPTTSSTLLSGLPTYPFIEMD